MQGVQAVLIELNKVLSNELTAINQYFLHARMYKSWGFYALNEHDYRASIKAMKIADALIERILFLEGLPNLQQLGKLFIGENPKECLDCDLMLATAHVNAFHQAIKVAENAQDFITRNILSDMLRDREAWVDWLETQVGLVQELGVANYLQAQIEK